MTIQPTLPDPLPVTYQRNDVAYVYETLLAGESCALVGSGSVGKSNLLHFLTRQDVRQYYLGDQAGYLLMVLLNPHQLIHPQAQALALTGDTWQGYEIMLSRLRRALYVMMYERTLEVDSQKANACFDRVTDYYERLFDSQPLLAQTGIRQLEDAVYDVMQLAPEHMRVAFMFDEFEQFIKLPPAFFQSLRGVRDEHRQRLMFLTASRCAPDELASEQIAEADRFVIEGFVELFHGFTHYISLLDHDSSLVVLRRLANRYHTGLNPSVQQKLLFAVGGKNGAHAGLLRRGFRAVVDLDNPELQDERAFIHTLLDDHGVYRECQTMFDSITGSEQRVLQKIADNVLDFESGDERIIAQLARKHLVVRDAGRPLLTIPVLAEFLMGVGRDRR